MCDYVVPTSNGVPHFAAALVNRVDGFDASAFTRLAVHEPGHFWFEARNRLIVGLSKKYFPAASSYLEIGCGTGFVLAALAKSRSWVRLVGSEIHPSGMIHAQERAERAVEFVQMDARSIPARGAFDLVGAFDVLEHIEEDEAVMHQIHAILAPQGGCIIAVPQHPWLWSKIDTLSHHFRRYRLGETEQKLEAAGFEILFTTSYVTTLLPFMMARKAIANVVGDSDGTRAAIDRELRPPRLVNNALRMILHAEVALSLHGVRWPIGGSRVVVARKR